MKRLSLRAFCALSVIACALSFSLSVPSLHAQTPSAQQTAVGLTEVGQTVKLSGTDPRVIVVRIINISLSLIGIILVSIIVYAGFLWMTSGGNPEKIEKAKAYLRNAMIGLIIILSSWAITKFILTSLLDATNNNGSGSSTQQNGSMGGSFGSGGVSGGFVLEGIEPFGSVPVRNVQVRFLFSQDISQGVADQHLHVVRASDSQPVAGQFVAEGGLVTFTPSAACPAPNADRFCLEANTDYIGRVDASTTSTRGQVIACGGLGAVCEGRFRTGDQVDVSGPTVTLLQPFDGQSLPQNSSVELIGMASDDGGVSLLEFSADGRMVDRAMPPLRETRTSFEGRVNWNTEGVSLGAHQLTVTASDVDSNETASAAISVMIRPESCFNSTQDEGETGIDCGGACGACTGQACQVGADCSNGICTAGVCVDRPVITAMTPNAGRIGTIITISGSNFGATPGEVMFAGGARASFPQACSDSGTGWSDQAIIVEVPVGAQTGPISVKNRVSNLTDGSDDAIGPRVGAYTVNDQAHPGLCGVTPDRGSIGTAIQLYGSGFGSSSDRVRTGDATVTAFRGWTDRQILMNVPSIPNGIVSVRALIGQTETNPVPLQIEVTETTAPPVIDAVEPATGPIGEYLTIRGRNFGARAGSVRVTGMSGTEGDADTTFPEACDQATRYWSDTAITMKVPPSLRNSGGLGGATVTVAPGAYQLFVQRQDGSAPSNRADMTVTSGEPSPGLCAVSPDVGPIGTEVTFSGERFGTDQGMISFQGSGRSVDAVSILEWADQRVRAVVPTGASTGAVRVKAHNLESNPLPYDVRNCAENASICSESERCCEGSGVCVARAGGACPAINRDAHYAWRLSTGELPIYPEVVNECSPASRRLASPSPSVNHPGGDRACVNTDIIIRFSTRINRGLVNGSTVVVRQCADATGDCSGGAIITPALGFPRAEAADTDTDLIRFRPSVNSERWSPGTNYQVWLTTGIQTPRGIAMPERAEECGSGNAYCFRFATRSSAEVCAVGAVLVNPSTYNFDDIDATTDAHANPLAADDACLQLNPDSYPWSWSVVDRAARSDARVSISSNAGSLGQSPDQIATSHAEVDSLDPSLVTASITAGRTAISGYSEMSVALKPFIVESYGPDCNEACTNAAIWAKLSTQVLVRSVTPANIELRRCVDVECAAMDDAVTLSPSAVRVIGVPGELGATGLGRFIQINPIPNLRVGQTYRLLLKSGGLGGIVSTRGQSLASINDPRGFAWKFRVKTENDGLCATDRVLLAPSEKVESVVGARQRFTAVPMSPPDSCSDTGQYLIGTLPYAWSVVNGAGAADPTIARLVERTDDAMADGAPEDNAATIRAGQSTSDQQLAEIIATRDPGEGETRLMTKIQATYDNRAGRADYGLLCGQRLESSCPSGSGLTAGGCCAPRPVVASRYPGILPAASGNDICRNTEIFADFQVPVSVSTAMSGMILAKKVTAVTCPASTQPLDRALLGLTDPWYSRTWRRVVAFFRSDVANADVWCVGAVPGAIEIQPQGAGSRVIYRISSALEANTEYRVYIRGASNLATVTATTPAIRSERGVVMAQEAAEWTFRTGTRICEADNLSVTDASAESPYLYTHEPESHEWHATVQALSASGQEVPITPVREYAWDWQPWLSSKTDVLSAALVEARTPMRANVAARNKNGQSFISARFQITRDEINTPSTAGRVIEAAKSAVVNLCERPWPSVSSAPFTDGADSASLRALAPMFAAGPTFYNFSTMYCMDGASKETRTDDLASMNLAAVPLGPTDTDQGIVRQYLFTFAEPAFRGDGIGIRIASNPLHLTAARWYAARGFAGTATPVTVDGYDAVRSGDTVYISASNLGDGGTVSSNIYIISRNPNATEQTASIFNQLVANFLLNTNLTTDTANVCVRPQAAGGASVELQNGQPVSCSADWECGMIAPVLRCAGAKSKLLRDRARIADFQTFNINLETYRGRTGKYPSLATGSFLPAMSTSRWPSWDQALSAEVGAATSLPRDPVNRFLSCGRCQATNGVLGHACSETGECSTGQTCVPMTGEDATRNGFDPATCWNPASQRYLCPAIQEGGVTVQASHVYQYRAIDQGARYELSTNFEGPAATLYRPSLVTTVSRCSNSNQPCTSNSQCSNGGTCRVTGGTWLYGGMCNNQEYSTASSCAATGPLGAGQTCRSGETRDAACTVNGQAGTKIQICGNCTEFIDGPQTVCTANISCGNGRIDTGESCDDGSRNGQYGFCSRNCQQQQGTCGDGVIGGGEVCDNGSPARASVPGTPGVNGAYCQLDARGAIQACDVARSCSLDCRTSAPHCGDGVISAPEQCDGNTLQTAGKLCIRPDQPLSSPSSGSCTIDDDCATGEVCGPGPSNNAAAAACPVQTVRECSGGTDNRRACTDDRGCGGGGRCITLSYPTFHIRSCNPSSDINRCNFNSWSACRMVSSCGDGVLDPATGEECDDGASGNTGTGRCTPMCKLNICGDGFAKATSEDCDWGGRNGVRPPTVQYGSPAPICTTSCRYAAVSGGFCGNNIIESNEACDGTAVPLDATCRSLGFDFATAAPGGRDALSCSNRCEITGCQLCSATAPETDSNRITGRVVDGILQNRGLPRARVLLRYNGAVVDEAFTNDGGAENPDLTGTFRFFGLQTNAACGNYSITVSLQGVKYDYANKQLRRTADANDGYYPFISPAFSLASFRGLVGINGTILLVPHPGENETIAIRQWKNLIPGRVGNSGSAVGQQIDPQLVMPKALGFKVVDPAARPVTYARCLMGTSGCMRTINWETGHNGDLNMSVVPNAGLACYESGTDSTCGSWLAIAETVMYRRATLVDRGTYRYFLVDYRTDDAAGDGNLDTRELENKIRLIWRDSDGVEHYQEIQPLGREPPGGQTDGDDGTCRKYWHVYDQDSVTGQITIVNRFMCNPSSTARPAQFTSIVDDGDTTPTPINVLLTATGT